MDDKAFDCIIELAKRHNFNVCDDSTYKLIKSNKDWNVLLRKKIDEITEMHIYLSHCGRLIPVLYNPTTEQRITEDFKDHSIFAAYYEIYTSQDNYLDKLDKAILKLLKIEMLLKD